MSETLKTLRCTRAIPILGNAVFWAAAILAASNFRVGGNSMTTTGILIACWFAVHSFIQFRKLDAE